MLKQCVSRLLVPIVRNAMQKRCISVICGPPTKNVPKGELYLMASAIVVLPLIFPIYVTYNIRHYRNR